MLTLPSPAVLQRRCEALARLDNALDPDGEVPVHDFDRRAKIFWLRENDGNFVQISFRRPGVVILGFDHDSPMSPARNEERIWPGLVDPLPKALQPALRDYSLGDDITFCFWREARGRLWKTAKIRRPRGRDVDGSARLLAILDGDPRRYRRYAEHVFGLVVPLDVIREAYEGKLVDRARIRPKEDAKPKKPKKKAKRSAAPSKAAKPKFAIGDRVLDPWGRRGKIQGFVRGLAAAKDEIGDVDRWIRGLSIQPKTPRRGVWYTVRPSGGGELLVGELDLQRASARVPLRRRAATS